MRESGVSDLELGDPLQMSDPRGTRPDSGPNRGSHRAPANQIRCSFCRLGSRTWRCVASTSRRSCGSSSFTSDAAAATSEATAALRTRHASSARATARTSGPSTRTRSGTAGSPTGSRSCPTARSRGRAPSARLNVTHVVSEHDARPAAASARAARASPGRESFQPSSSTRSTGAGDVAQRLQRVAEPNLGAAREARLRRGARAPSRACSARARADHAADAVVARSGRGA